MRRRSGSLLARLIALAIAGVCVLAFATAAVASPGPLAGVSFFTDPGGNLAGTVIGQIRGSRPDAAAKLQTIADEPETHRFGTWDGDPVPRLTRYLDRAAALQPGSVPLVATYRLEHKSCGNASDSPAAIRSYEDWYRRGGSGRGASSSSWRSTR